MKICALIVSSAFSVLSLSALAADYPTGPDASLTPGALCQHADQTRYPEHIKYCNRDVSKTEKAEVIDAYDDLGYRVRAVGRQNFKIDHYIPLCMGGANSESNLWPQHLSISAITDPLEEKACEVLAKGAIRQSEAISIIQEGKANLDRVPDLIRDLESR